MERENEDLANLFNILVGVMSTNVIPFEEFSAPLDEAFAGEEETVVGTNVLIERGTNVKCVAGAVYGPDEFYLIINQFWNPLEDLMHKFQNLYGSDLAPPSISLRHANPGMYCAVWRFHDQEWHRGRIIKQLENGRFEVFTIDYGDKIICHIQNIKYLTKQMLHVFKPQAIKCFAAVNRDTLFRGTLQDGRVVDTFNDGWLDGEKAMFKRVLFNKDLGIHFHRKITRNGEDIWAVAVHVLSDKVNVFTRARRVDIHHLEKEVIKSIRGSELQTPIGQLETRDFLRFKIFPEFTSTPIPNSSSQ